MRIRELRKVVHRNAVVGIRVEGLLEFLSRPRIVALIQFEEARNRHRRVEVLLLLDEKIEILR